jgi:aldehyde:ferredoxin oxidoreductase
MVRTYRERMGWEPETGRPRPETLEKLGLAELVGTF